MSNSSVLFQKCVGIRVHAHRNVVGRPRSDALQRKERARLLGRIVERWLGTLKSECLKNAEHETPAQLEDMIRGFVDERDTTRPHQSLGYATPSTWYLGGIAEAAWARMQG